MILGWDKLTETYVTFPSFHPQCLELNLGYLRFVLLRSPETPAIIVNRRGSIEAPYIATEWRRVVRFDMLKWTGPFTPAWSLKRA